MALLKRKTVKGFLITLHHNKELGNYVVSAFCKVTNGTERKVFQTEAQAKLTFNCAVLVAQSK